MSLVVFEDVSLGFGRKQIVEKLNLRIGDGDRVGLIGPNGSGKSSLLRMVAGEQSQDKGALRLRKGLRLGYLPQDIHLQGGRSLMNFVRESVPGQATLVSELERAQAELTRCSEHPTGEKEELLMELAQQVADLHEAISDFDLLYSEHEAARILDGLGFTRDDLDRDMGEFSGGWKMRAMLSALLFQKPDLLLLDEPTNHLDMPSVAWFSAFLRKYRQSFVLICHDREFLNEQIDRVVSFEVEGVRQYRGDYQKYRKQRDEELEVLGNKAKNLAREREKAEQFIERFRAQANKAKAVQSRVKSLEKMEQIDLSASRSVMRLNFPPCERAGAHVVKIEGLAKHYDEHRVLSDVNLVASRGERIGIIGVNGAGKTTLLRMIAQEIETSAGKIAFGSNVKVGYYAQHHADTLAADLSILDCVQSANPMMAPTRVRSILGAFLFTGDDIEKKIQVLSGGERARVALARLIVSPGNLMLLDEPTNHLDLESSESLAQSLCGYDGTLLFVSHNRSFVRTLATQIWNVENGAVEVYPGSLDEYMHACAQRNEAQVEASKQERRSTAPLVKEKNSAPSDGLSQKERRKKEAEERKMRKKRLGPLEKAVAQAEQAIAELEEEQRQANLALSDQATYEDAAKRDALLSQVGELQQRLERLQEDWEQATLQLEDAQADFS